MKLKFCLFILCLMLPLSALQAKTQLIKIATLAPDGTNWMTQMRRAGKEISKRTDKRVKLKFFPGGIMGNEKSVLRKIRIGQLHGAALTSTALSKIAHGNHLFSLPMKFRSYEEMSFVRAKMDEVMIQRLKKKGFTAFKIAGDGFAYLLSKEPITGIEDLKRQKVWIPQGDVISRTLLEHVGISPISLPLTDVLTGLQTGLITTVGSSPGFTIALQWHTKVKYLVDLPIFYTYGAFVISNKAYNKISKGDQVIVREVLEKTFTTLNKQNWENNQKAKTALRQQGIKFITPDKANMAGLMELADEVTKILIKQGVFLDKDVQEIERLIGQYRQKKTKLSLVN